ncbi:MAG: hypothetical protein ACXWTX_05525, partial [Gallionella sp.]
MDILQKLTQVVGIVDRGLTDCYRGAILLLSPSLAARDWRPVIRAAQPQPLRFFCAQNISV